MEKERSLGKGEGCRPEVHGAPPRRPANWSSSRVEMLESVWRRVSQSCRPPRRRRRLRRLVKHARVWESVLSVAVSSMASAVVSTTDMSKCVTPAPRAARRRRNLAMQPIQSVLSSMKRSTRRTDDDRKRLACRMVRTDPCHFNSVRFGARGIWNGFEYDISAARFGSSPSCAFSCLIVLKRGEILWKRDQSSIVKSRDSSC